MNSGRYKSDNGADTCVLDMITHLLVDCSMLLVFNSCGEMRDRGE